MILGANLKPFVIPVLYLLFLAPTLYVLGGVLQLVLTLGKPDTFYPSYGETVVEVLLAYIVLSVLILWLCVGTVLTDSYSGRRYVCVGCGLFRQSLHLLYSRWRLYSYLPLVMYKFGTHPPDQTFDFFLGNRIGSRARAASVAVAQSG